MSTIYLASSWRNEGQPAAVKALRNSARRPDVYDFRNPYHQGPASRDTKQDGGGFAWSEIDPQWESWTPWAFRQALDTTIASNGFKHDFDAMEWADIGILLLPCGRSAHTEAGYFAGHPEKRLLIVVPEGLKQGDGWEPELMYLMADGIYGSIEELIHKEIL